MIIALNTEQLQEMAKIFEAAQASATFEAPWWRSNEAGFPNDTSADGIEMNEAKNKNTADSTPTATTEDAKPAAKTPPENARKECPRKSNCRPYSYDPNAMFQHCLRMKEIARRQKQGKKTTRIVEQKSPIHMHEETKGAAKMSLDLTGFSPSNISINVEDYIVSIVGNRTNKLGDVFVVDRRFRLDKNTAIVDQVTATFEGGILELTVPKKSVVGPRKIPIIVSDSGSHIVLDSKTETMTTDKGKETSQPSSLSLSSSYSADEVEDPQSTEEPIPTDGAKDEIAVKTADEDEETIGDQKDSHTNDIAPTKSFSEDETWEEVSN